LIAQLTLQFVKRGRDLLRSPALLVDRGDPLLEINTGLDSSQDFVAGAKYSFEKLKLLVQELKNALIGRVVLVDEVHNDNIVLLPISMAAPDTLRE
jgi:hypothetical protein